MSHQHEEGGARFGLKAAIFWGGSSPDQLDRPRRREKRSSIEATLVQLGFKAVPG